MIKNEYGTEYNLFQKQRCLCGQMRSGILPLAVETGWYVSLEQEKRFVQCAV